MMLGTVLFSSLLCDMGSDILSGRDTVFARHIASFLRTHNLALSFPPTLCGFRHILQLMNSPPTPLLGCDSIGLNSVVRARALQHAELVGVLPGKWLGQN